MRCWSCNSDIGLSDIVRHCMSCHHGMCSSCLSIKVGKGENFLCPKCSEGHSYTYRDKVVPIITEPSKLGPGPWDALVWCVRDQSSGDMLYVHFDGVWTLAYNRHLSNMVKLVDKLYDAGITLGRTWLEPGMPKQYPEIVFKLGGSTRKTIKWQRYDTNRGIPHGKLFTRDYGHDWLGDIIVQDGSR